MWATLFLPLLSFPLSLISQNIKKNLNTPPFPPPLSSILAAAVNLPSPRQPLLPTSLLHPSCSCRPPFSRKLMMKSRENY
ncbi:hypothetical protein HanIR_Chr12g0586071 [Helianthus annuus]|nr:hypothetical protein HanIR_Chr12g0586071 [Helianthus annuus]